MPFEYGFKEKVKLVKLKGGKPKIVRVKKERELINLGAKIIKEEVDILKFEPEIKDEIKKEKVSIDSIMTVVKEDEQVSLSLKERITAMRLKKEQADHEKKREVKQKMKLEMKLEIKDEKKNKSKKKKKKDKKKKRKREQSVADLIKEAESEIN